MSEYKFEVGDTVRCINPDGVEDLLTKGKTYQILSTKDHPFVSVISDKGSRSGMYSNRFVLVQEDSTPVFSHTVTKTVTRTLGELPDWIQAILEDNKRKAHKLLADEYHISKEEDRWALIHSIDDRVAHKETIDG